MTKPRSRCLATTALLLLVSLLLAACTFVPVGDQRVIGWVRADMVTATNKQPVFPTATNP